MSLLENLTLLDRIYLAALLTFIWRKIFDSTAER